MCVFVGPTLRREQVAAICDADCLPPVAQGDVYRATQRDVRAIGIVDGYFSGAPAVWHKEILWALSRGVLVFGSASMGALRAAELHGFGMLGVGRIFEAFRDGTLEDDDEVAVVHGPEEVGFVPVSEPMVNIRATLARAEIDGVLAGSSRHGLERHAKSLFFPHRTWPAILDGAPTHGVPERELAALRDWLPHGRVDQKREDAVAMLKAMNETVTQSGRPRLEWQFEWTHFWDEFIARPAIDPVPNQSSLEVQSQAILEELRLEGEDSHQRIKTGALLRLLARLEADRRGIEATPEAARAALSHIRRTLGLFTRAELDAWLERNHLAADSLERLVRENVRVRAVTDFADASLGGLLLDELRLSGTYEPLAARAQKKQTALDAQRVGGAEGGTRGPTAIELRLWFFEQRLRRPMPDDVVAFARHQGFADLADFDGALRREWLYFHTKV
jgi:hypothetical protein